MELLHSPQQYLYNLHTTSSSEAKRLWRQQIREKWNNKCAYCGSEEKLTIDHIIPQAKGKKVAKYKNGQVEFSEVITGNRDSSRVLIISGIEAGDSIILTGLMGLKPGMKIKTGKINSDSSQEKRKP